MPSGSNVLGSAVVRVSADTTPLKAGMAEAEAVTRAGAASAGAAVGGLDDKIKQTTHTIRGAARAVEHFFAAFTLIPAVAIGMYEVGRAIREQINEALEEGHDRAEKFLNKLDAADAKASLREINKQITEVQSQLSLSLQHDNFITRYMAGARVDVEKMEDELTRLTKARDAYLHQERAAQRDAQRKTLKDAGRENEYADQADRAAELGRIQADVNQRELEALDDQKRAYRELEERMAAIARLREAAVEKKDTGALAELDRLAALTEKLGHQDIGKRFGIHMGEEMIEAFKQQAFAIKTAVREGMREALAAEMAETNAMLQRISVTSQRLYEVANLRPTRRDN